jgi:Fe-S-cluster-containing dehydrogenase component
MDLNRCVGCHACVIACAIENGDRQEINWREVYTFNETRHPNISLFNLSMACNHCGKPACVNACPASAYSKDNETGAVTINQDRCLGCKYCTWACPYDAPKFSHTKKVIEKCDFCIERLKKGESPACVCACPVNALRIEDSNENIDNPDIEGFTNTKLQPSIKFNPLREHQRAPENAVPPPSEAVNRLFESSQHIPRPKITLKSEWTLLTFTSIAFILVALLTAAAAGVLSINPYLFAGSGAVGMILSSIHLGQKHRAFRAISNFRRSWLSREIVLFSAFIGISFVYLRFFPHSAAIGWTAVLIGFTS